MANLRSFKDKYIIYFILFAVCAVSTGVKALEIIDELNEHDYEYVPVNANDNFSWKLVKNVLEKEKSNVVLSPYTVKILLSMLAEAAGDGTKTQSELYEALQFTDNSSKRNKAILTALKKEHQYVTLNLETKMFANELIEPTQEYLDLLTNFYGTEVERLDFKNGEAAANNINSWCKNVTNGMLQELVKAEKLENTILLLASVMYFNGLWMYEFSPANDGKFYAPKGELPAQYIELTEYMFYHRNDSLNLEIVRIPYKGKNLSMFILLPKTRDGIDGLIKSLENDQVKAQQFKMEGGSTKVTLPKFKFDFESDLKSTLSDLGIEEIFTDKASLPALDTGVQNAAQVSSVMQKAGITLNEKGTEAFSAVDAGFENRFGGGVLHFNVDRPFIFFIEEEATGTIILAGKVLEPTYP